VKISQCGEINEDIICSWVDNSNECKDDVCSHYTDVNDCLNAINEWCIQTSTGCRKTKECNDYTPSYAEYCNEIFGCALIGGLGRDIINKLLLHFIYFFSYLFICLREM
jgi:hypothetical protein